MALSKLRPPIVADPSSQRMIQEIYGHLNGIISAVNQEDRTSPRHSEGKPGDIRLVKGGDGDFYLQGRFEEGWVGTVKGTLKFQSHQGALPSSSDLKDETGAIIAHNVLENPVLDTSAFGGSSPPTEIDNEVPSGLVNSTNLVYTLAYTPTSGSLHLRADGACLKQGVDYTLSTATITLTGVAPTQWIEADYRTSASLTEVDNEAPSGTVNGSNLVFTLADPPVGNSLHVRVDGVCMKAGVDYTLSSDTITFIIAPAQWVECDYKV